MFIPFLSQHSLGRSKVADFTTMELGAVNGSGDRTALFLKVFGGEVLTAFMETTKFLSRHMVRSISSGK